MVMILPSVRGGRGYHVLEGFMVMILPSVRGEGVSCVGGVHSDDPP